MSDKKNKNENADETKQHQNRGARGLQDDSVNAQRDQQQEPGITDPASQQQDNKEQFQGEYHEEGKPVVRGSTSPEGHDAGSLSKTARAHQGKGGLNQNNLGQHSDRDDDFQSGSKGGNRSGKTGSKQGGSRGKGTM